MWPALSAFSMLLEAGIFTGVHGCELAASADKAVCSGGGILPLSLKPIGRLIIF
jgi:hypothetical protein